MSLITADQAIEELRAGRVVAVPTETVYGLAGAINSPAALTDIFALKRRPSFDPLIVHVHSAGQARGLVEEWPDIYDLLVEKFWPGPLTLIAKKTPAISPVITSGLDTVGLRCPQHAVMLDMLRRLNIPLAAPSANLFGQTSPTAAAHVEAEFEGKIPVVDGGPCEVGVESTVVSAQKKNGKWTISILRPGGVSRARLADVLKKAGVDFEIELRQSVASPGHLTTHYQPRSPVILLENKNWSDAIQSEVEKKLGRKLSGAVELQLPESPQQAARMLYESFRRLSTSSNRAIWIARRDRSEDWEAIWDRVERAASLTIK